MNSALNDCLKKKLKGSRVLKGCYSFKIKRIGLFCLFILVVSIPINGWSGTSPMAAPETGPGFTDDFKVMLEGLPPITNIKALNQSFNSSQVAMEPWSDSYWPHYRGLIATRFSDPRLPDTKSWPTHHNFYLSHSAESYINSGRVNQLSPAEKYDLLVGDRNWTLTKHMWALGREYMSQYNFVPTWVGICQGWGAASQIGLPSPEKEITVMDVNQTTSIKFNRFDITALVSYLWAKPQGEDRFTGRRCRNPNNKDENGRVLDGACFDNNPMTWHLSVVNRVGALKKAFVMDIESQAEVWNYVIDSYNINYFNPADLPPINRTI